MFKVYVLLSERTGKKYVGQTMHIEKRLLAHNNGDSRYTKGRGPWQLIYNESCSTRSEAIKRERYLKTGKGREFIDSLTE
jgi:putative endonuclease